MCHCVLYLFLCKMLFIRTFKLSNCLYLLWIFFSLSFVCHAEDLLNEYIGKSLDELLDIQVYSVTKSNLPIREAPAIVRVITREQIEESGALDLIDLLRLIPGVQFGIDVQAVVGIGLRGLWGHEGRVLLLWDGHEMNELMFSTSQFMNHYPVDEIDRIEVVSSSGSVLYGGYAELAVINIITKNSVDRNGGAIYATVGRVARGLSRRNVDFSYGKEFGDLGLRASIFSSKSLFGDGSYTDINGTSVDMIGGFALMPTMGSLALVYKDFEVRFLVDEYDIKERDEFGGDVLSESRLVHFGSSNIFVKYASVPSDNVKLVTRLVYQNQVPWGGPWRGSVYRRTIDNYKGQFNAQYDFDNVFSGIVGVDYSLNQARDPEGILFSNGRLSVSYWDYAPFAELGARFSLANIRVGLRFDESQEFGSHLTPRLSITKAYDKLNYKFLISSTCRNPGIENISNNEFAIQNGSADDEIRVEEALTTEFELGYIFTNSSHITLTLFDARINKPVVYFYDEVTESDGYKNLSRIGSQGLEVVYHFMEDWGNLDMNYSFYRKVSSDVDFYEVPNQDGAFLAFAQHTLAGRAQLKLSEQFSFNPSIAVLGDRYGYVRYNEDGELHVQRFGPSVLLGTAFSYRVRNIDDIKLLLGISNLLNANNDFIQPYANEHAPLGGLGREFWLKVLYKF